MDLKLGASVHNRFDIRVIRDGKVIQEASAENIVLDRMYTRICQFAKYFDYIHFGTGTGTQSAGRTTLFTAAGYKSASTVETVYAFPVSKVTRKIQINPEEYVGSVFTEVGISESTSAINTHALIKDAEGVNISITKTALDLVEIYATVYVELDDDAVNGVYFNRPASSNGILKYFLSFSGYTPSLYATTYNGKQLSDITAFGAFSSKSTTMSYSGKLVTWATIRYAVGESNTDIINIGVPDCFHYNLKSSAYAGVDCTDTFTGDGTLSSFDLKHIVSSGLVVTVDDVITQDYTLCKKTSTYSSVFPELNQSSCRNILYDTYGWRVCNGDIWRGRGYINRLVYDNGIWVNTPVSGVPTDAYSIGASENYVVFTKSVNNVAQLLVYTYDPVTSSLTLYKTISNTYLSPGNEFTSAVISKNGKNLIAANGSFLGFSLNASTLVYDYKGPLGGSSTMLSVSTSFENDNIVFVVSNGSRQHLCTFNGSSFTWLYQSYYDYYLSVDSNGNVEVFNGDGSSSITYFLLDSSLTTLKSKSFTLAGYAFGTVQGYLRETKELFIYCTSSGGDQPVYVIKFDGVADLCLYEKTVYSSYYGYKAELKGKGIFYAPIADGRYNCAMMPHTGITVITFNTPPASGAVVKASYHTDCIPKTTDYVLDVGFTLQFGEGTV